jgi:hypothetical protein
MAVDVDVDVNASANVNCRRGVIDLFNFDGQGIHSCKFYIWGKGEAELTLSAYICPV